MNKKIKYIFPIILLSLSGCKSAEITMLGGHMLRTLAYVIPFITILILSIFAMNKYIVKDARTNDLACSIIGAIIFPLLFLAMIGWQFGVDWITITISIIVGGTMGWFSYMLDELLESFWDNRRRTIPGTIGFIFGGWMIFSMFTQVWIEGDMYITHKASARRVVIERYEQHTCTDDDGDSYDCSSWDYYSSSERIVSGDTPPNLVEGKDYQLGYGHLHLRDKVGRFEEYKFIGGHFWSEDDNVWRPFRWLLLDNTSVFFDLGFVQRVKSNFYKNPIESGGKIDDYGGERLPKSLNNPGLPLASELPPAMTELKILSMGYDFFLILFTEHEYQDLLNIFGGLTALLATLAIFFPWMREPIIIFLACASIIVLLLLILIAARTGGLSNLLSRKEERFGGGGGGRSGGGGASGSW